jgi:CelD/BcsL family acetyltransferase involved in cellulose biosynthesis
MILRAERPDASPFLHWHWFDRFWEEMVPGEGAAVIAVWREGRLIGAAPVVAIRKRAAGISYPAVTGMENAHTSGYEWLLAADAERAADAAREIAGAIMELAGRNGAVSWRNAPRRSTATDLARSALDAAGRRVMWRAERPHRVVHFPDGADALLASFSPNMRARLRKSSRRLERMGAVRFEEVSRAANLDARLAAAWELESRGWKGRSGTAVARDERIRRFYDSLAFSLVSERRFTLFELACGDKLVAFLYGLVEGTKLYGLKFSYDTDFSRVSAGHLIIWRVVEWAGERGIHWLDLGRDSEFKSHWNGELVEMGAVGGIPGGFRGAIAMLGLVGWPAVVRRLHRHGSGPRDVPRAP